MTTLDILALVGQHLTDLNLPGILAVLPPGDERIPQAGRDKHPDKSLLIFEQPLDNADSDRRNQLQQKLPGMTVANVGIYVQPDNGKPVGTAFLPSAPSAVVQPSAEPHTRHEVFMGEITAADLERKLDEGFTRWHADFKGSKLHVVLVRQVAVEPTPQPEQKAAVEPTVQQTLTVEQPAEPLKPFIAPVGPSVVIVPPPAAEPVSFRAPTPITIIDLDATPTPAEAYLAASNQRIFNAAHEAWGLFMASRPALREGGLEASRV